VLAWGAGFHSAILVTQHRMAHMGQLAHRGAFANAGWLGTGWAHFRRKSVVPRRIGHSADRYVLVLTRHRFYGVKNGVAVRPAWILRRNHIQRHWKTSKRLQKALSIPNDSYKLLILLDM